MPNATMTIEEVKETPAPLPVCDSYSLTLPTAQRPAQLSSARQTARAHPIPLGRDSCLDKSRPPAMSDDANSDTMAEPPLPYDPIITSITTKDVRFPVSHSILRPLPRPQTFGSHTN